MAGKVIMVVILILVVALGVFIYQVAAHPKSFGLPSWLGVNGTSSAFNFTLSSFHGAQGPQGLPPVQQTQQTQQTSQASLTQTVITSPASSSTPVIDPSQIPAGFTLAQLSPYFHQVRFENISAGSSYFYGTIVLYNNFNTNETVDITGWQIKTQGSGEYIPQAVNLYDPSGLMPASDIAIHSGDLVTLYSSSAPFNLRLNECVGYIAHVANFNPPLPISCPYVDRSAIQNFTGSCQNYLYSLGSCQVPDALNPSVPRTDYACQDYIENNFNYKSCFSAHVSDPNFLSNQVWVWTGSNVVNQYHDIVKLFDRNGLLVDYYSY